MVSGASSGIGAYIVELLVRADLKVVGLARSIDVLQQMATRMAKHHPGTFYPVKCDLRNEEDILEAFKFTEEKVGPVNILINNAGFLISERIVGTYIEILVYVHPEIYIYMYFLYNIQIKD